MSPWGLHADDAWVIATAICCNVACGLLGCFLVLRRLSLMGDAISHAILPGLAAAFILTNSRAALPMMIGAMIVGLLTAMLTSVLHRWGKVPPDAAMGVVFTSLFALGVLLISRVAADVDLDPGCVLYGLIEFVPLDRVAILGFDVPRAAAWMALALAGVILAVTLFYKELKIVAFDPALAASLGIPAGLVHYGLMAAVAVTAVSAFESVGSILVVAMLIAPGATAHLLTERLGRMLFVAAGSAALSAVVGFLLADHWNTSVAGMMSVAAGAQFAAAVFFAPHHGYVSKRLHQAALARRIVGEDILGMLYRWEEAGRDAPLRRGDVLAALGGGLTPRVALWSLLRGRRVAADPRDSLRLTPRGTEAARGLVRSHRLWESYLAKHLGLPLDHLHEPAMRMEHYVGPKMRETLAEALQDETDPHGREIPP
jgi:manganese/zinc/iron transport system permease protein